QVRTQKAWPPPVGRGRDSAGGAPNSPSLANGSRTGADRCAPNAPNKAERKSSARAAGAIAETLNSTTVPNASPRCQFMIASGRGCPTQYREEFERFIAWRPGNGIAAGARAVTGRAAPVTLASMCGPFFGSTTTLVPTLTRLNRSATSSLVRRIQPLETNLPMVEGSLVPWMRYSLEPRYNARAPSGLPWPPAM